MESQEQTTQIKKNNTWWQQVEVPRLNVGSVLSAKVIKKNPRSLYLDLNQYGTGLIWGAEFTRCAKLIEQLNSGDVVKVKVLSLENEFGMIELTIQDIVQENQYQWIKELMNNNQSIVGKVIGANRGGLLIKINDLQGFLPTSQMSEDHFPKVEGGDKEKILENLEQLIEQDIEVKIINFNSTQGKIIVSEKKIEEDKMNDIINKYKVGDIVEGTFNKSINGGAIISLKDHPLIKAFLPIEEISWTPIENLEDIIKPDQIYKFKLISINKNRELILSLRELQEDPVIEKLRQYKPGQIIKGKVYKFIPVGALIQIEDNVFGFVHSSEFGGIEEMQSKITLNQELEFIVSEVNPNEKRINLSLKK